MVHSASRQFCLFGVLCLIVVSACENKPDPNEVGYGLEGTGSSAKTPPKMEQRCELNETIRTLTSASPEETIADLLEAAASEKDDDKSFAEFFELFAPGQDPKWVRSQYWKAARQHVHKFLEPGTDPEDDGVIFTICRREGTDDKVKIHIKSYDMKKTNPPIRLEKSADGDWKVTKFSP